MTGLLSTGAEPEPEAVPPQNALNDKYAENNASQTHVKGGSSKPRRQTLPSTEPVGRSKRPRAPPAQFSMNKMGGQNDPLPLPLEERILLQQQASAALLASESEDSDPTKKRKYPGGATAARGRSKSAGAAGDRGKKQRRGGSAGASIGRARQTNGEDQDEDLYGGVDMVCALLLYFLFGADISLILVISCRPWLVCRAC